MTPHNTLSSKWTTKLLFPIIFLSTLISISSTTRATDTRATDTRATEEKFNTEELVAQIVDEWLASNDIYSSKLPNNLYDQYEETIKIAKNTIDKFLRKFTTIEVSVDVEIEKRLIAYGLSSTNIPSSLSNKFKTKRQAIIDATNKVQNRPITRSKIKKIVKTEISYPFIQEIKNPPSTSWLSTVSTAITAIANTLASTNNTPTPTPTTSTTNLHIHYQPYCCFCSQEFYGEERVGVLNCGHVCHPECSKTALTQSKLCPQCNAYNIYLAKIYDNKYNVPGYYNSTSPSMPEPSAPDYPTDEIPDYNPEIYYPEPSAPDAEDNFQIYKHDECSICLDDFYDGKIAVLNCGHMFHEDCVKTWLATKKTCPFCRKEGVYIAKIYNNPYEMP